MADGAAVLTAATPARPTWRRHAVQNRNIVGGAAILAVVILVTATAYVLINLVVDVLYVFIDPRIRYG